MANITGMTHLPHDKTFFGDRLAVPNRVSPIWWQFLPPNTVWSAPMVEADVIAVGHRDDSLSEAVRNFIGSLPVPFGNFEQGANDFRKMGYFDLQGWIISYDQPLLDDFTDATPEQIVDDFILKVPVPYVAAGEQISADDQLQTVREAYGEDATATSAEGEDAVLTPDDNRDGLATSHPAVIKQVTMYDLGPQMFFEKRVYLGTRRGNAIPVGEQQQLYATNVSTNIDGIATRGKYGIVMFTVSMPHLNAFGTPNDELDEPISPYDDFNEFIMTYNRVPLENMEMQDEISLANARYRFRQDASLVGNNLPGGDNNAAQNSLWGITGGYEKYLQEKRQYSVKRGTWEQKPLMFSLRVNHTLNVPFVLIPNRM